VISAKEIITNNANLKNKLKNNDKTNNDKINNDINKNIEKLNHRRIEVLANDLVDKLNSPNSYKLFCKIAYNNPEPIINRCLGLTLESSSVRNKGGYFVSLIKIYGNY
jgi:hypothetical protein